MIAICFNTFMISLGCLPGLAAEPDNVLDAFEQTYADIVAQVKKGKLSAEVSAEANALRIALKKYLIKSEAQIEILQLDVLKAPVTNVRLP
jgi:hypothetical protein